MLVRPLNSAPILLPYRFIYYRSLGYSTSSLLSALFRPLRPPPRRAMRESAVSQIIAPERSGFYMLQVWAQEGKKKPGPGITRSG
jgi:hypothetical protein